MTKRSMSDAAQRRFSGAAISGRRLYIATIEVTPLGSLVRSSVPTGIFRLADRRQTSTVFFRNEVRKFCRRHEVENIYFRINKSGQHANFTREIFKIEAVLDLIPGVELYRADPNSIQSWVERSGAIIPEHTPYKYKPERTLEQQAIDVAAYFASNPVARTAKCRAEVEKLVVQQGL